MGQQDQDAEGFMLNPIADTVGESHPDLALGAFARSIYLSRRERDKTLSVPGLFQDPAWDIMLDLFMSHADNKHISVMSAGLAGQVPPSTALRWVWALEDAKLVERKQDTNDKRRSFVFLTPAGLVYMRGVLVAIKNRLQSKPGEVAPVNPASLTG